jgi:aspartyl-tRNA(Asn)/glutamyl-tRNA(Gln) amidotransferase subunit A
MTQDITLVPVHQLSRELQERRLSPVELVDAFLARIEAHDSKLHAFNEVYAEEARLAARAAEAAIRAGHAVVRCTAFRLR